MGTYWATRDFDCEDFHIEAARASDNISFNQVWELNGSVSESEVWVEGETLEEAAIKALNLFKGEI
jgi:hypothetical protein